MLSKPLAKPPVHYTVLPERQQTKSDPSQVLLLLYNNTPLMVFITVHDID